MNVIHNVEVRWYIFQNVLIKVL